MTTQIKYLAFKGIEKKERILFKSFLNLAKNELEFQVVILKEGHDDEPDFLIHDESYILGEDEEHFQQLPTILVGLDSDNEDETYICRPVQWSDFKLALSRLNIPIAEEGDIADRALPKDVEKAIMHGPADRSVGEESWDESTETEIQDFEFGLESMSVDDDSFTDSEYLQVADDVEQFNQLDGESTLNEAVLLVADDESTSVNSVLVIETNEYEAWNFSQSETTSVSEISQNEVEQDAESYQEEETVILEQKVGMQLKPNEEYWLEDNEIIVNHETLFYIKPKRSMVYSFKEPGYWPDFIREGQLSRLPLNEKWQPVNGLQAFPISCLHWVNSLVYEIDELVPELDPDGSYILQNWPQFDLIEMDNALLKLCTMLFTRPESVKSLVNKSGNDKSVVVGLINACHRIGLIKTADEFEQENSITQVENDGVLGKFIDVFR